MTRSIRRLAPLALAASCTLSGFGSSTPIPRDQAAETSIESKVIPVPRVLRLRGDFENQLPAALQTMSGADVQWLTNPPSVIVRGTGQETRAAIEAMGELEREARAIAAAAAEESEAEREAHPSGVFDLDFPGGTLAEYLAHLREVSGSSNVVVLTEELHSLAVPRIQVSRVSTGGAVRLIEALSVPAFGEDARIRLGGTGTTLPGEQQVWILSLERAVVSRPGRPPAPQPNLLTGLHDLSGFRERPEAIAPLLEAIGVGIEVGAEEGRKRTFSMKLHERTHLLFVRGTADELAMVEHVISNLIHQLTQEAFEP